MATRARAGPAFVDLGEDQPRNVFGLTHRSLRRAACMVAGPLRVDLRPTAFHRSEEAELLDRLAGLCNGEFASPTAACASLNPLLWSHLGGDAFARLAFLDDGVAARALARHLRDESSPLARLFLDRDAADATIARLGAESGAPRVHLWGVLEGRCFPVRREGVFLLASDARAAAFRVASDRESLAHALEHGHLRPGLLWALAAIAITPRVRILGGARQARYLPRLHAAVRHGLQILGDRGDDPARELAEDLSATPQHGWSLGAIFERRPASLLLATTRDPSRALSSIVAHFAERSLAETSMGLAALKP
jgi:hypothetical protein